MFSATKVFILYFLGIIMLQGHNTIHALVRRYRFEVINYPHARLCTTKTMVTVNGQFPGPIIYARRGDLVIVDIINRADQNITIHWHGVKMPRYPWSDGTNMVTQCPIRPGRRFRQRIILSDEEGTLWWHAHNDWSRATVHGAIIILPPKNHNFPFPKPHAQVPLILGEWWNDDVQFIMEEFLATGRPATISDAFLFNGQPGDLYPCSKQDTFKLKVEFGKTYLMRMINAAKNIVIFFRIAGHTVTVVGSDGAYTKPLRTDYIAIAPGQTFDFILEANQPPSHYYMAARVYALKTENVPITGIIEYVGNYTPPPSPLLPSFPELNSWTESSDLTSRFSNQLRSLANEKHPIHVPKNITHNLLFVVSINGWPCTLPSCADPEGVLASVNNVSMLLPRSTDILHAYYRGIAGVYTADFPDHPNHPFDYTHDRLPANESRPQFRTGVRVLEYNTEVEIVFQGTILAGGLEHPMHLHGHSFYVVGSGFGNFDPAKDPPDYNLVDPPLMESIVVPRIGWTAIRFKANNPGVWYMHCHFERHHSWGMKMAFIVKDGNAPDQKMLPPPPDLPRCGGERSSDPLISSDGQGKISNPHESTLYNFYGFCL